MAKLNPKDPQFGIPIATRIREELAHKLNEKAEHSGKTLSRYVAELIEKASTNEKRLEEISEQLTKEKELAKKVAGRFILEITEGNKSLATKLIQTYNSILNDERRNSL